MRSLGKNRTDRNGLKQGLWEDYWEHNNILCSKGSYMNGEKEGIWEYYYSNGKLVKKELYENGNLIEVYEEFK